MSVLRSYFKIFYVAKAYSLYVLLVLFLTFMLDQLDRYALPITSIEAAQDLKYGDRSCLRLSNQSKEFAHICSAFTHNETV